MKRLLLIAVPCLIAARAEAGTLTLDQALETARRLHPQLRVVHGQTEAASARVKEARAPLLPQVNGVAFYQRSTTNYVPRPGALPKQVTVDSSTNSFDTAGYYNFGITANQLIYDFGQSSKRWYAAKVTLQAQKESESNQVLQVAFGVRTAFNNGLAARALVKVAEETLNNQDAHLAQIQGFVKAGTRPEIDLAQARTDQANARVQLINAQNNYRLALAQLNQAMGLDATPDYDLASEEAPAVAGEEQSTDALLPEALRARPDVQALQKQIQAQDLTIRATQGGYGPALGVSTGLTDAGTELGNMAWNWSAALTLTWNLFGGQQTSAQVREARANASVLRAQLDVLRQQVRLAVEQARLAVLAARASLDATKEAATNARERLRLAEGRYRAGVGNVIELGDAQVAMTAAAAQEVQAQYQLATARAQLILALGRP
jgi:outer membrane protein